MSVNAGSAGSTHPDAAALWRTTLRNWHRGSRRIAERLAAEDRLAPPWTVDAAADMLGPSGPRAARTPAPPPPLVAQLLRPAPQ
ncbi:MAG: hypothetical protein L0H84_06950, partial [Pseudonocardia sp.]|nr:hypothetical protein [Pseudonocardia sp.]